MALNFKSVSKLAKAKNLTLTGKSGRYVLKGKVYRTLADVNRAISEINLKEQINELTTDSTGNTTINIGICSTRNTENTENRKSSGSGAAKELTIDDSFTQGTCRNSQVPSRIQPSVSSDIKQVAVADDLLESYFDKLLEKVQQITQIALKTSYNFKPESSLKVCGDLLIPLSLHRIGGLEGYRFFKCEFTDNLTNFAYFTQRNGAWEFIGHLFKDRLSGYWVDSFGIYLSLTDFISQRDVNDRPQSFTDDEWLALNSVLPVKAL
jgi:hypothetical protein